MGRGKGRTPVSALKTAMKARAGKRRTGESTIEESTRCGSEGGCGGRSIGSTWFSPGSSSKRMSGNVGSNSSCWGSGESKIRGAGCKGSASSKASTKSGELRDPGRGKRMTLRGATWLAATSAAQGVLLEAARSSSSNPTICDGGAGSTGAIAKAVSAGKSNSNEALGSKRRRRRARCCRTREATSRRQSSWSARRCTSEGEGKWTVSSWSEDAPDSLSRTTALRADVVLRLCAQGYGLPQTGQSIDRGASSPETQPRPYPKPSFAFRKPPILTCPWPTFDACFPDLSLLSQRAWFVICF